MEDPADAIFADLCANAFRPRMADVPALLESAQAHADSIRRDGRSGRSVTEGAAAQSPCRGAMPEPDSRGAS